jgi:hypothetical protein
MPIQLEISHFDRLVVGVARGDVSLQEFGQFVSDVVQAGVIHYRKIIDTTTGESATLSKDILIAIDAQLRALSKTPRGPLAIVANRNRGEIAQAFKAMTSESRPIEVFRSIHEARAWVATFPVAEAILKPAVPKPTA